MRKSGDPFEVEPLPKTFYYPSQLRELPEEQRKICLSPGRRTEDHLKSPADEKFLQKTNHLKIHEVPTRENGTRDPDQSSSSKFDESWPSTERAMVSTPEADTEISEMSKTPTSEGSDIPLRPLPDSTLARYIHRFRHAPPCSRQARDHNYFDSGKGGEFWWLSPSPPSSSTPKESTPPDWLLGPSPRPSLSPKLKRIAARKGTSTASPISRTKSSMSPSKSSLDGLDTKTADLQRRARTLLEKSESTLDTSSSEVYRPVRKPKQGPSEDRAPREAPSQHTSPGPFISRQSRQPQPRPAPPPEEDILYQWRLARKMERAQEQVAKWGPSRSTISSGSTQPCALPSAARVLLASSQKEMSYPLVPGVSVQITGSPAKTQTTFSTPGAIMCESEVSQPQMIPTPLVVTSQAQAPASNGESPQTVTETSTGTHQIVPSTEQSSAVTSVQRPVVSGQVREPFLVDRERFESADIPSHMHLSCDILPCPHQKTLIEKRGSNHKIPLSSPVVESMLGETHMEERDTDRGRKSERTKTTELRDKKQIRGLPRTKQNGIEDKEARRKVEPVSLQELRDTSPEDTERERHRTKDAGKRKVRAKRDVSQRSGSADVLSGVIGQVVSERLFSARSPRSSTSSLTGSENGVPERPRESEMSHHSHASEEEIANPESSSDNEFPDDEVLKMLRQQARRYRQQLRQIDSILNQQTSRPGS